MSDTFVDPTEIKPNNDSDSIKFNLAGTLAAIVRTVIDLNSPLPSLGASSIVEWVKAVKFERPIEKEAFVLLTKSLIAACRSQLKDRIDVINESNDGVFIYLNRELGFMNGDIRKALEESDYSLRLRQLDDPRSISLLADFKPFYKEWIIESFPISDAHADVIVSDFPDHFAYQLQMELSTNGTNYPQIIKAYNNPFNDMIALTLARRKYRMDIKARYHQAALGQEEIALSDIYIEPSFSVYENIIPKESRNEVREKSESGLSHFLETDYQGSLHHYLLNHFIKRKESEAIGNKVEKSRMMILMGQPGHGKSSFCYRTIHDLENDPEFSGNTFFVRLQEAGRDILNTPLIGIAETKSISNPKIRFIQSIEQDDGRSNVVFLDGLDEFYMTKSLSDADVSNFLDNCKRLVERYDHLYFIITSRFNYVETNKLYNDDCLLFSLGTLNVDQQKEMVAKYNSRMTDGASCFLTADLLKRINSESNFKHVKELIELPILLQMILMSKIDIEKADSRAQIYDQLFTTVLDRKWDRDERLKKYKAEGNFTKQHLRGYISFLAYKMFQLNKGFLNKSDILGFEETGRFVRKRLKIENEDGQLRDVLKDILTSFYLKESIKEEQSNHDTDRGYDYAIEFLHKSLYEYLACEYLWNATKKFFLEKDSEDPKEYKDHNFTDVQRKMQQLFAHTSMTSETMGYMADIIIKDRADHQGLSDTMSTYLPDLLKYGFLSEYTAPKRSKGRFIHVEVQAMNGFHNYWLVLGNLLVSEGTAYRYIDDSWNTLVQDDLFIGCKDDMIEHYNLDAENISTHLRRRRAIKDGRNDTQLFEKLVRDNQSSPRAKYQKQWIRGYLFSKHGAAIMEYRNVQIQKQKESFIYFLRLWSSARKPMNLNLNFLNLERVDLIGLVAPYISMIGTDLRNAYLRNAYLRHAYLSHADLSHADLSHADLRNADLRNANLSNADLSNAYLSYAYLSNAYLSNAYLSNAYLRNVDLSNAYLSNAYLRNVDLSNANLSNADLSNADLSSADLRNADLRNANLSYADLSNADLSNADLSNADLSYADLSNANLSYADLSNADLSNAYLSNANLSNANLSNANLRNANLRNANLSNADLSNVDLRNAELTYADLRKANLNKSRVIDANWLQNLAKKDVIGAEMIVVDYKISKTKKGFIDRFNKRYEAYEILLK